jgi:Dullard-like phosphatase family protein
MWPIKLFAWLFRKKKPEPPQTKTNHDDFQSLYFISPKDVEPPKRLAMPTTPGKLTVVLDMNETLVHSVLLRPGTNYKSYKFDAIVLDEDGRYWFGVYVRPFVRELLAYGADHWEMVLFTASSRTYARPVMDAVDPHGYIQHRLYRESCSLVGGILTKPLQHLGRPMSRIVLVDNSEMCMLPCPDNGLPINSYFGGKDNADDSIRNVISILRHLDNSCTDVRPFLVKTFALRIHLVVQQLGVLPLDGGTGGPIASKQHS